MQHSKDSAGEWELQDRQKLSSLQYLSRIIQARRATLGPQEGIIFLPIYISRYETTEIDKHSFSGSSILNIKNQLSVSHPLKFSNAVTTTETKVYSIDTEKRHFLGKFAPIS